MMLDVGDAEEGFKAIFGEASRRKAISCAY